MTEPERPAPAMPASGRRCVLCLEDATGWRYFARVKQLPGSWKPTCTNHRCRSGVPKLWRVGDCDNET